MDADGLPLIGPGIDFTKVEAIHQKRTLAFLNHFITHTAHFMNRFSCVCEEKLADLSVRIQRLETSMSILEAKLSSIPGLDNITVAQTQTTSSAAVTTQASSAPVAATTSGPAPNVSANQENTAQNRQEEAPPESTPSAQPATKTVAQDPAYAKFLKMLKLGVPEGAIKMKMQLEGLNPDLLDTPDAPAPSSNQKEQDDSDVDFSDDNKSESDDSSVGFSD